MPYLPIFHTTGTGSNPVRRTERDLAHGGAINPARSTGYRSPYPAGRETGLARKPRIAGGARPKTRTCAQSGNPETDRGGVHIRTHAAGRPRARPPGPIRAFRGLAGREPAKAAPRGYALLKFSIRNAGNLRRETGRPGRFARLGRWRSGEPRTPGFAAAPSGAAPQ